MNASYLNFFSKGLAEKRIISWLNNAFLCVHENKLVNHLLLIVNNQW